MLTFRRALVVAAAILTCFLLLRNTHSSQPQAPTGRNSPKPTGTYEDNKALQNTPPESASTGVQKLPQKVWDGDNGGRVALVKKPIGQMPMSELKAQPLRKQLQYAFPSTLR